METAAPEELHRRSCGSLDAAARPPPRAADPTNIQIQETVEGADAGLGWAAGALDFG